MSDEAEAYLKRFGIVAVPTPKAATPTVPAHGTTLGEAIKRIENGTFYEGAYSTGPGISVLRAAHDRMQHFCDRVEAGTLRSKRTYAEFCAILGRVPRQ